MNIEQLRAKAISQARTALLNITHAIPCQHLAFLNIPEGYRLVGVGALFQEGDCWWYPTAYEERFRNTLYPVREERIGTALTQTGGTPHSGGSMSSEYPYLLRRI